MKHQLFWIFGTPQEEAGELAVDFYYQAGKHTRLHITIPAPRFHAAGELPFHINNESGTQFSTFDLPSNPVEAGKKLFALLGEDAQKTLIRTFANLENGVDERALYLVFSSPQAESYEWSLTLEDLPWEYLHDGNGFISNHYQLQIIRNHTKDHYPTGVSQHEVDYWRILLVSPFVFAESSRLDAAGLTPLPGAQKEIESLYQLASQTNGFIQITPLPSGKHTSGITQFHELESILKNTRNKPFHIIHFCGHGVMIEDEPCLCFEHGEHGEHGIEYVSVAQFKQMLTRCQNTENDNSLPRILYLNACSSSSRGKYSAGFAAGLQSLHICVLGYQTHVQDDDKLIQASHAFYRSLCLEQPLQQAHAPSSVVKAVAQSRKHLLSQNTVHTNHSCNLQVYLPEQLQFRWTGRGFLERTMQSLYSRFAEWMNPQDYTSHLSIVFFTAILFGTLFGIENLLFVFPEPLLTNYLNYTEIVSELIRIFMIGPLSFLAAAVWIAWLTQIQYQLFTAPNTDSWLMKISHFLLHFIPISLLAGISYSLMFSYSFSHLDLLTAKTKELATLTNYSTAYFWYGLSGFLGLALMAGLAAAAWICYHQRETLHNYQMYSIFIIIYITGGIINAWLINQPNVPTLFLMADWFICSLINITAFALVTTKVIKETGWRSAHQTSTEPNVKWRKLLPLMGGAFIVLLCYILLEESVRFERDTIQWALEKRSENAFDPQSKYVEKVLERALRQRAIDNVPERVRQVAENDWLLSLIFADHLLFLSQNTLNYNEQQIVQESNDYLENSKHLNPAVQYTDYYRNIYAMIKLNNVNESMTHIEIINYYNDIVNNAKEAVKVDDANFAYLDTLAQAQYQYAIEDNLNFIYLSNALDNIRQAEWCAFFLRSPKSQFVQNSIHKLRLEIENDLAEWNN